MRAMSLVSAAAIAAIAILAEGCALYPDLSAEQSFIDKANAAVPKDGNGGVDDQKLRDSVPILFCGQSIAYAEVCALVTDEELASLLGNSSTADRTLGYTFVGIAAAAAALAHGTVHTNAIKNLAIATGTLVGLRSVAQTDKQRQVASAARNALECMTEAADLAAFPPDSLVETKRKALDTSLNADFRVSALTGRFAEEMGAQAKAVQPMAEAFSQMGNRYLQLATQVGMEVETTRDNAARELATGVIRLRISVRSQLASSLPSIDDIATTRLAAINSLIGEFLEKGRNLQSQFTAFRVVQQMMSPQSNDIGRLIAIQGPVDSQVKAAQSIAERCGVSAPSPTS